MAPNNAAGTVFGELEISKSIGHTPFNPPQYISSTVICYISGNAINFIDITDTKKDADDKSKTNNNGLSHFKQIVAASQITAFGTHVREAVIAYSERGTTNIHVSKWPDNVSALHGPQHLQADTSDLGIIALTFSFDGKYLASMSDMPGFRISIWDWKNNTCICSSAMNEPATSISFNPSNWKQLCTSGSDNDVKFWRVDLGYRENSLKFVSGSSLTSVDALEDDPTATTSILEQVLFQKSPTATTKSGGENSGAGDVAGLVTKLQDSTELIKQGMLTPLAHAWMPGSSVVTTWGSGDVVTVYSPAESTRKVLFSAFLSPLEIEQEQRLGNEDSVKSGYRREHGGPGNFKSIIVGKNQLISGGNDGVLRILNKEGDVQHTVTVGAPIENLSFSPDYKTISILTSDKAIYVYFIASKELVKALTCTESPMICMALLRIYNLLAVAHENNQIHIWDMESRTIVCNFRVSGRITCIAANPCGPLLSVGTEAGFLRVYDMSNVKQGTCRLILREKLYPTTLQKMMYDVTGKFLATQANSDCVYLVESFPALKILGFFQTPEPAVALNWDFEEAEEGNSYDTTPFKLFLFALIHQNGRSFIHKFQIPTDVPIQTDAPNSLSISNTVYSSLSYKINELIQDYCPIPSDVSATPESFYTVANDKKLKVYGVQSQRSLDEATKTVSLGAPILETEVDVPDDIALQCLMEAGVTSSVEETVAEPASSAFDSIKFRVQGIREKIVEAMEKNATLPELERLTKDEFVLDFEEQERLLKEAEARVSQVRKEIEESNMKKRVIRERIKRECWDSMEVIGQTIVSFHPNPVTTRFVEVSNFPIRQRDQREVEIASKVQLLRRVQMAATIRQKKTPQTSEGVELEDATPDASPTNATPSSNDLLAESEIVPLLYDHFELTSDERRRTQIVLLGELNHELKLHFNSKFREFEKLKKDEIMKIEDKNDRIQSIMTELQIQETVFHPTLLDDEVPERIIEVLDSEVTVERFITAEEQARIDEKRRIEEERLRAQQSDNSRERALMIMMGGKLDDKTEESEKEGLVRPEWMNKPKEEMTEDERKLVKEFEKKLATYKEEQEKYKKALETELRKLQTSIQEICDTFDQKLTEFFDIKMRTDQAIYQNELKMLKMVHVGLFAEGYSSKELEMNSRLEELKSEKMRIMAEIPEIKKEVEHCREDYDTAVRKDKEIEKQFKKDFYMGDATFEALFKLFKKRQAEKPPNQASKPNQPAQAQLDSPFGNLAAALDSTVEEPPIALSWETDQIEGVSMEVFRNLCEVRDRKIAAEGEAKQAYSVLSEVQQLLQGVMDENERIKKEIEKVNRMLTAHAEAKFQSMYNMESLIQLKQGQIEVPQAPVVTDYSDAALIHRSVVEKLNDAIVTLGKSKVEALTEMKDYRKGIHALEWENKILDFQAEDLVIRTRDIQLLRVTKNMQEYIRGGDERKQQTELIALEKRSDHSQHAHVHKLEEKKKILAKFQRKIQEKELENAELEIQLRELEVAVRERTQIQEVQAKRLPALNRQGDGGNQKLKEIYTRRRLIDLAKSQAQDIAILREEVERLRLRTYPAFPAAAERAFF